MFSLKLVLLASFVLRVALTAELPTEWVDPDTGHRVIRLSKEDGTQSLYFNQNAYTADGSRLIVTTPGGGIATVVLATREITPLVPGPVSVLVAGHKSGDVYYTKRSEGGATVYATNVNTGATREVVNLPRGRQVASLNADETLLLGTYVDGVSPPPPPASPAVGPDGKPMTFADAKDLRLHDTLMAARAGPPRVLFTVDTRTGAVKEVLREHEWLGHLQFSPTDPHLIMFCHEGTWHEVDRIWTVRTDGTGLKKIHARTMNMEIAGHEFFSADGKTIWYDLQTPRGQDFWLAGYDVGSARRTWYHLLRDEWSVHFNVSPDGKLFAGDGGDSEMVARAPDGKWLYLFRPERVPDVAGIRSAGSENLIEPGFFRSEKLVNMKKHDYRLEPNVTFSPDRRWIVFRSNMLGPTHVFAVEIAKTEKN